VRTESPRELTAPLGRARGSRRPDQLDEPLGQRAPPLVELASCPHEVVDQSLLLRRRETAILSPVSDQHVVQLWDVSWLRDPYQALCAQVGRAMTPAEWKTYVPDLPNMAICGSP